MADGFRYVRRGAHHGVMFGVELVCSDEKCALAVEAIGELIELELLVCEGCGCTLQVTAVWEAEEVRPPERAYAELPLAA